MLVEFKLRQPRAAATAMQSVQGLIKMNPQLHGTKGLLVKRASKLAVGGSIPLVALLLGISPSLAQPITPLDNSSLVPSVTEPQSEADKAVLASLHKDLNDTLDTSTDRLLAEDANGKYAVALTKSGNEVCIISQVKNELQVTGTSCARKEKFAQDGVSIGLQGTSLSAGNSVTYLFPLGVDATPLKGQSKSAQGQLNGKGAAHVIVQTATNPLPDKAELKRDNSSVSFKFQKLHVAER